MVYRDYNTRKLVIRQLDFLFSNWDQDFLEIFTGQKVKPTKKWVSASPYSVIYRRCIVFSSIGNFAWIHAGGSLRVGHWAN